MEVRTVFRCCGNIQISRTAVLPGTAGFTWEKKIRNLIKYAVVMAVPLMIEVLPNIGNIYFKRNVLGFGVLKFVQKPFTIGFFDGINLVAVTAAFMLVWAYQKKTKDNREMFSWGIFFCVGMSFAIFGFSSWNPAVAADAGAVSGVKYFHE